MEIQKGIKTSEVQLAFGTIAAFLIAKFTGIEVGAEMLGDITSIVIAVVGGRTGLKAVPSIIAAILSRKVGVLPYGGRPKDETMPPPRTVNQGDVITELKRRLDRSEAEVVALKAGVTPGK
jgi:hypothetical protein